QIAWPSRSDGPLHSGERRGARPGDPPAPGRSRLRTAAAQGRIAVSGIVPPRKRRRGQGGLGIRTARPARRPAAHLLANRKGTTQARRGPSRVAAIRPRCWRHSGSTRMNEFIQIQLKILVERTVRSVRATIGRKRKMREELMAHLTAVFAEETKLGD